MNKLTLIIPIYSGISEIKECLDSVFSSENNNEFDIILVDDNPENSEISELMKELSVKYTGIKIIYNDKNLGFSKSVNNGMTSCLGDIIILNSDTIVSKGFVDKFIYLSKIGSNVGTISTLTNNGTILSVPRYNKASVMPIGFDVDKYQMLISSLLFNKIGLSGSKLLMKIPTPVGHCMFISRAAISNVGLFDDRTFELGYGEENDYGERVKKKGFKNYAALDIFVFHKGAVSFKKNGSKYDLMKKHMKIINRKYPLYRFNIKMFVLSKNPLKKLCNLLSGSEQ